MSSSWGKLLRLSVFGQSHSPAIGFVLDGLPAGIAIDMDMLYAFMARRAPGGSEFSTSRREPDIPEILSGISGGVTCGAPISGIIRNTNTRPGDYADLLTCPRPGHADFTAWVKYHGFQDSSGGGHFSGRLTAPLCAAGNLCMQLLAQRGIDISAHILSIHGVSDISGQEHIKELACVRSKPFPVIDDTAGEKMMNVIREAKSRGDSVGGIIECIISGVPAGIGDPMFDGLENRISSVVFGIPAVKGIEFGVGFGSCELYGSENNDGFAVENGRVVTLTNNHGGILGGISSGMPIVFRAAVKPTPSIFMLQKSVNLSTLENTTLSIKGRHDPCIVPRAVPCMEAAAALAITDALLEYHASAT